MDKQKNKKEAEQIVARLQTEKEKIKKRILDLKADDPFSDPDHANDNAAVDTEVREQTFHQVIEAEVETLEQRLRDIETALTKINKGRYGYCARCGKAIPAARLALIPEAQYCVDCENKLKK